MPAKIRSLLEELSDLTTEKNRCRIIESKSDHIINSAINLLQLVRDEFDSDTAETLIKRFLMSIKTEDPDKFSRALKAARSSK